jgi:hypothetical protein
MSDNRYYVNYAREAPGGLLGRRLSELEYVGTYSQIMAPVRRSAIPRIETRDGVLDSDYRFQQDAKVR